MSSAIQADAEGCESEQTQGGSISDLRDLVVSVEAENMKGNQQPSALCHCCADELKKTGDKVRTDRLRAREDWPAIEKIMDEYLDDDATTSFICTKLPIVRAPCQNTQLGRSPHGMRSTPHRHSTRECLCRRIDRELLCQDVQGRRRLHERWKWRR